MAKNELFIPNMRKKRNEPIPMPADPEPLNIDVKNLPPSRAFHEPPPDLEELGKAARAAGYISASEPLPSRNDLPSQNNPPPVVNMSSLLSPHLPPDVVDKKLPIEERDLRRLDRPKVKKRYFHVGIPPDLLTEVVDLIEQSGCSTTVSSFIETAVRQRVGREKKAQPKASEG